MRAVGAGARIFELLERNPSTLSLGNLSPPSGHGVVSFNNVSFEYPSRKGVPVLKNLNMQLKAGESVAIV